jgi:hypothetical protein
MLWCSKLHIMQARVGPLLQQGWNVASIICGMQLSRPHCPQYGQIAGRDAAFTTARKRSAAIEMADTNPSTMIRRVMEQLVSRFFCLILIRDAAMITRDSSNSILISLHWSSPAREGRTLANGVHGGG